MLRIVWLPLLAGCSLLKLSALERSFPTQAGELTIEALPEPIRIVRDAHGVPHLRARTEAGAWYGLGFLHGQDRLFQADLMRRLAFGRTAAWFGPSATRFDHFMRAMRLEQLAEANLAAMDAPTRAMLEAYTDGLNAAAAALPHPPIEHRLLDTPFEPWSPRDCLAVSFLQSWNLSGNLRFEAAALMLAELEPGVLDELTRTLPDTPPIDDYWEALRGVELGELTPDFEAFISVLGGAPDAGEASNNWVVGPQLTASGAPIVANDPHLRQGVPSLWYVADVAGGDLHVAGATLPGLPGVPIGHNGQVAWGLTNVMADTVDLVVLERHGETGYVLEGQPRQLREVWVHSDQREGPHVPGSLWTTEVGPVITELQGTHLVALRWATLELNDTMPQVLRSLATSTTVDDALAGARSPMAVAQNVAIADTQGGWGWQVVGSVPARRSHTGRVPYPGSDPAHGWDGWLEALPGLREPTDGFVITANSRPDHPLADAISTSYVPDHRYDRIRTLLLEGGDAQEPADQHQIQLDELEVTASRYLPALLEGVEPSTAQAETCLQLLQGWDHVASAESAGAAAWALFHRELLRQALVDDLGDRGVSIYLQIASSGRSLLESGALDAFLEDRALSVDRALQRACTQLSRDQGPDPALWTYGALHPLRLQHPFARRLPKLLARWNMREIPWGGSGATVAAAGYSFAGPGPQLPVTGMPSLRIVMPLDDLGASTLIHPGGQSGMPGHVLYASHFLHFVNDSTLPLLFDDDALDTISTTTLQLVAP